MDKFQNQPHFATFVTKDKTAFAVASEIFGRLSNVALMWLAYGFWASSQIRN